MCRSVGGNVDTWASDHTGPYGLAGEGGDVYGLRMRTNHELLRMHERARQGRRCIAAESPRQARMLSRRYKAGDLMRVYPGMYMRPEYWNGLTPTERVCHLVRSLAYKHPEWVFAGECAACVHGLEVPWVAMRNMVYVIGPFAPSASDCDQLQRIHAYGVQPHCVDGIKVTRLARTVIDCACAMDPYGAVAVLDSAIRKGLTKQELYMACNRLHTDCAAVFRLLPHADQRSENGGESYARAVMTMRLGFAKPQQQVVFVDPLDGCTYRVDYCWRLADGTIIVAELDGMEKYTNPSMANGRSARAVVNEEKKREDGLRRAGVSVIVRFTFDDALHAERLERKLVEAGVPKAAASVQAQMGGQRGDTPEVQLYRGSA